MNMLSAAPTMSSREIATLCGKQHNKVVAIVIELLGGGVAKTATPHLYTHEQNGQQYTEYILDKRDSLLLVARLSPEFTAAIIDRWQELEAKQHAIPQTYAGALALAAEKQYEVERLATKIKSDTPKVAFADRWMNSTELHSITQTAKLIGIGQKYLHELLEQRKIIFRCRSTQKWEPTQRAINAGYMVLVPVDRGTNTYRQAKATGKGLVWFNEQYGVIAK